MTDGPNISDELLTAYLDDEVSESDRARIETALEQNPGLADRLASLDIDTDALRHGADLVLGAAPAMPEQVPHQASAPGIWRGLIAAGLVVIGVGLGAILARPQPQDWVHAVANYQSLYVTETLARSEPDAQRPATLARLSETIGVDLSPLLGLEGVSYRRAQLLGFEGRPLVQVAYLDGDAPIAICITSVPGEDSDIRQETLFGLASAAWQEDGLGYLVIGGDDPELIRALADAVRQAT